MVLAYFAMPAKNPDSYKDENEVIREFEARRKWIIHSALLWVVPLLLTIIVSELDSHGLTHNLAEYPFLAGIIGFAIWAVIVLCVCRCPTCGKFTKRYRWDPWFPARCPYCGACLSEKGKDESRPAI